jgi:hypothetical protein
MTDFLVYVPRFDEVDKDSPRKSSLLLEMNVN